MGAGEAVHYLFMPLCNKDTVRTVATLQNAATYNSSQGLKALICLAILSRKTMAGKPITPQEIEATARNNRVPNPTGPNGCYWGWYMFHSNICGHMSHQYPLKYGQRQTLANATGLCSIPAPVHHIGPVRVNEPCSQCR